MGFTGKFLAAVSALAFSVRAFAAITTGPATGGDGSSDGLSSNNVVQISTNVFNALQRWNVKAYGASGNADLAADSLGLKLASSNCFRFGGMVYFPAGHYLVTNLIASPGISTNGYVQGQYSDISVEGENMGSTIVDVAITNNTFWSSPRHHRFANLTLNDVNFATRSNFAYVVYDTAVPEAWQNVRLTKFYVGARVPAVAGWEAAGCVAEFCGIGVWIPRYSDAASVSWRVTDNKYAGIFVGGTMTNYGGGLASSALKVRFTGARNLYDVAICGGAGVDVSGMSEGVTNACIAAGIPPGFMGETNLGIRDIKASCVIGSLTANGEAAVFEINSPEVSNVICENSSSDYFVKSSNSVVNTTTKMMIIGGNVSKAAVRFSNNDLIPSIPGSILYINWDARYFNFVTTTNNSLTINSLGVRTRGYFLGNTDSTLSTATLLPSPSLESWRILGGSILGTANQDQIFRVGMVARDGGNTPQTLFNLVINGSSAGAHHILMGGGTSIGKPFSAIDWYFSDDPTTAHAGTNTASLDSTALSLKGNTRLELGASSIRAGAGSPEGVVTANISAIYLRTNGSAGTVVYIKESNNGANTGWVAYGAGGAAATGVNYGDGQPMITPGNGSTDSALVFNPDGGLMIESDTDGPHQNYGGVAGGPLRFYVGPLDATEAQPLYADATVTQVGGEAEVGLRIGSAEFGTQVFGATASATTVTDSGGSTAIVLDGDAILMSAPEGFRPPSMTTDPGAPTAGVMWFDSNDNAWRGYNGVDFGTFDFTPD